MAKQLDRHQLILVDAHVHIYSCFELTKFFDSAINNFRQAATNFTNNQSFAAILLLAETSKDNYFDYLANLTQCNQKLSKDWTIKTTSESSSLIMCHSEGQLLYLIAGRQIITAENLEVLSLIGKQKIKDGKTLSSVVRETIDGGAIPVIPWGFGKWIGARGTILKEFLTERDFPYLFLGDNSGRPSFWSKPRYFKLAREKGIHILPGSDPLPFASEFFRSGSFGFAVYGTVDAQTPAQSIKQILLKSKVAPNPYGLPETPYRFIRNQIAMQIVKRQRAKQ